MKPLIGLLKILTLFLFVMLSSVLIKAQSTIKAVTIGSQVWSVDNFAGDKFQNGETIPQLQNAEDWQKAGEEKRPAWCYYNNDPGNGIKYGKLYNWYAVNDKRVLAPKGWHIPSETEWKILIEFLGGLDIAGTKLKTITGWSIDNGTNSSGFTALPGGWRSYDGEYKVIKGCASFWSSTSGKSYEAWCLNISSLNWNVADIGDTSYGYSVRCIRD